VRSTEGLINQGSTFQNSANLLHAVLLLLGVCTAAQFCLAKVLVGVAWHESMRQVGVALWHHRSNQNAQCCAVLAMCSCRFLRIRSDKSPEDASGPDLVQQLYNKQNRRVHHD
jgi:hypothetical protein